MGGAWLRRWIINLLENLIQKLSKEGDVQVLLDKPTNVIEEDPKIKEIDMRLPLQIGDRIVFENGKEYKVVISYSTKDKIDGKARCYPVMLRKIVRKDETVTETKNKRYHFGSLRELNYYVKTQKYLIEKIIKTEFAEPSVPLSIDNAHEIANIWNEEFKENYQKAQ